LSVEELIKECSLGSGVTAYVRDCTRHYFGGYYHVRIQVSAEIPVSADAFAAASEYEDAVVRLGPFVTFKRTLEKMAVPDTELVKVRQQLLTAFDANVLPYLQRADFAPSFVRSEYLKKLKSIPCSPGYRS
jgi:hypothetical protein